MQRIVFWLGLAAASAAAGTLLADGEELGLKVPPGFEVSLFAGDDLAHDIYSLTLDSRGRVVVAGKGYVKTLHDDDGDGKADRASLFSELPKSGAHGLLFDGNDLLCTGDEGLLRLKDSDGDGQADGEPTVLAKLKHPEHGANGVVKGPDGWFYVICGNDAGVTKEHVTSPTSPILDPHSGTILRITPSGDKCEVISHGFRNPYDLAFGPLGNIFAVDSDGERDHHLPWYVPTRLFDCAGGMHHGWVMQGWTRSWSRPASFFDNVPPVAYLGRGSPTGIAVYQHTAFPPAYRHNVFSACWTLGRVYRLALKEQGDSYVSTPEIFLETTGEVGFAPVDLEVGKAGEMYVAIGGRGTRGSVFRITYRGEAATPAPKPEADEITQVLTAPQPLAAWSRADWEPRAKKLGRDAFVAVMASERPLLERIRAVEIVTEHFGGFKPEEVAPWTAKLEPHVAARVAWSIGRTLKADEGMKLLEEFARRPEDTVQRTAWSALLQMPPMTSLHLGAVTGLLPGGRGSIGQYIHALAVARSQTAELPSATGTVKTNADPWYLAAAGKLTPEHFGACALRFTLALKNGEKTDERQALVAIRLMQLALGDINVKPQPQEFRTGCSAVLEKGSRDRVSAGSHVDLAKAFPTGLPEVDRELARLLAMLEVDDIPLQERVVAKCSGDSDPQNDLHYLIVLSCLPGRRSATTTALSAAAIVALPGKMVSRGQYPSRNWPARVGELVERLLDTDPQLAAALMRDDRFSTPAHALFAQHFKAEEKAAAARKLVQAALKAGPEDPRWTPQLLELSEALPREEALPLIREAAEDFALRDLALIRLAKEPKVTERLLFVNGLESIQAGVVSASAKALLKIDVAPSEEDQMRALSALRQACRIPEAREPRQLLLALLSHWSGQKFAIEDKPETDHATAYRPVFEWFEKNRPAVTTLLRAFTGGNADEWQQRFTAIAWDSGDAVRGKAVFDKRSCVRCHSGPGPLGPDLMGAATRFARDDLFAAILDPSREVSPTYQTTQVVTTGGRSYQGLVIYESPDGTLLQTGPDTTVRIAGEEIVGLRKSKLSLMPTGLLNGATDEELADLYAYLRTLRKAQ